jgi:hypothetical protein
MSIAEPRPSTAVASRRMIEVWSIVYDGASTLLCRHSRYIRTVHPWELTEHDEARGTSLAQR